MEFDKQLISGKTVLYGLIGDPVDHSLSPAIQNAAFRSMRIDAVYVPLYVKGQGLRAAIGGLRAVHVKGFNVTIPHKVKILPYLDKIEPSASVIGSVNTVANEGGKLRGYSTDGQGALDALEEAGTQIDGKSVLILGAGGASRAVAYALADKANSIRLVNRTLAKAKQLATRLHRRLRAEVTYSALSSTRLRKFIEQADIIVNASSMGMNGKANPPIERQWLHPGQCVFDLVYNPPRTKLLELAAQAGANSVTGLDMLVNQGACSFKLWTGKEPPLVEMRHAVAQKLLAMEHAENG